MYTYKFFLTNPDLSLFQDILQKVQHSNFLVIQMANIALNPIWASYAVRNILISWEIESYPRKPFENVKNLQNWMNKTSFSFWDRVNSGLSKSCSKNLCKYEAIQTSQAAPRVHMYSIENQSTQLNFKGKSENSTLFHFRHGTAGRSSNSATT